ncbi:MAG: TniQ family protein [Alphaproteobacteria bacterium]|nr:TniQ family protein [Alphaproteobacteria bacterium]MBU1279418.1 TniQ family protein [Alphaproteobacteria bacterium]MBU1572917.1 TniQ family protein [Alphaproteobacteria bacterium]MBU1829370.1 TniQ family protein [Alphaproteobacteria bacterium]MBU2078569.1 TniQ family protein [Alphaproteobacteria bacterium]
MGAHLIPTLPLIKGETPSGYVSRTAQLYETTARDLSTDLGMRWPHLCSGYVEQLKRLSWLTGFALDDLRQGAARKILNGHYEIGRTTATTGVFRKTTTALCPQCVMEAWETHGAAGLYQLLEWSVRCLGRCEKHSCALIILPSAGHSHVTYDFARQVIKHFETVARAAETPVLLHATQFETYARTRIWAGSAADDWLQNFDLTHLYRASLTLGAALSGRMKLALPELTMEDERYLCEVGFAALRYGPENYGQALLQLRRQSMSERPYYTANLGPFYEWLWEMQEEPALKHLIPLTRAHIFQTYPVPLDKEVFGERPVREIWLTMEEARLRSGFGVTFLKKLLGHMKGESEDVALRRTDVRVDDLEAVQGLWAGHMNLSEAGEALGVGREHVKQLHALGVFRAIRINSALRYVNRADVDALLERVALLPKEAGAGDFMPLREFCRSRRFALPQLIEEFYGGGLEGDVRRGEGTGLLTLEIASHAVLGKRQVLLSRDLSLCEAASYLKLNVVAVRRLRDGGYLTQIRRRNPDTNFQRFYITKASIKRFEASYITLGQMADLENVAAIHLARRLDWEGIPTISCTSGYVRAYERRKVC